MDKKEQQLLDEIYHSEKNCLCNGSGVITLEDNDKRNITMACECQRNK